MENNRDRLVVIAAGYKDEMQEFMGANPGLKSRFKTVVEFPDYNPDEMFQIFEKIASEEDFKLAPDAKSVLKKRLNEIYENRDANFGNGRDVRNLFDDCTTNQATRLQDVKSPDAESLSTITCEDVSTASNRENRFRSPVRVSDRHIDQA